MNWAMEGVTSTGLPDSPDRAWFPPCLTLMHSRRGRHLDIRRLGSYSVMPCLAPANSMNVTL
jgi:hypothetical protein